jgi:hypothetical protein
MKEHIKILTFILLFPLWGSGGFVFAHIGSAGVVHEGKAGNYQVQVFIEPPDVIPGTAKVSVMVDGKDITSVKMSPIYYWSGDEGSPRSDEGTLTETGSFEGNIWLMENGASSVKIIIEGARGVGETLIPIGAVSTAKRALPKSLGWILAGLALLLVGILITIVGASAGDSLLKPGHEIDNRFKKRRIVGSTIGATFCGALLFVGNWWWNGWANDYYQNSLYHPMQADSKITLENGQRVLNFKIDSNSVKGRHLSYVIPDHGKLMHLFLVRQGTMDAFAHLHPSRKDTLNFTAPLPNGLPAGKYLVYADILRYHGFQYTIADTLDISLFTERSRGTASLNNPTSATLSNRNQETATERSRSADSDDTFVITNPINSSKPALQDAAITICGTPGVKTPLQDGSSIIWEEKPNQALMSGKVYDLKFSVQTPEGKEAELQTYLGMMGHAAVVKDDGSVYIHLHPNGTFSTTSVQIMENRIAEKVSRPVLPNTKKFKDSVDTILSKLSALSEAERDSFLMKGMNHATQKGHHGGSVSFPYSFPQAGNYRIWLQIKRNGKILTGAFDAKVI